MIRQFRIQQAPKEVRKVYSQTVVKKKDKVICQKQLYITIKISHLAKFIQEVTVKCLQTNKPSKTTEPSSLRISTVV